VNGLSRALENFEPEILESTFRDPAGELRLTAEYALRRIHPHAQAAAREFLASPLRTALEKSGDLIPSAIAEPGRHACVASGELWLEHPRIFPISYPWEWSRAQWRAAAELTLRVAVRAVDAGWTLKDATPLNIVFDGARPVLVDVLSLERRDPGSTVWLAYGQFVRSFLLPLVAAKYLRWPLENTLFFRDGYEPRMIYQALRPWQRWHPDLLDVVTLATLLEKPGAGQKSSRTLMKSVDPELAAHILKKRMAGLERKVRNAAPPLERSQWSQYTQSATHYSAADVEAKLAFVRSALDECRPKRVLDIGANTGTYSMLSAEAGAQVVALDNDAAAIETLCRSAGARKLPIAALIANIARPTPAVGWRNREQLSLLDRLSGSFDFLLMLAVIHHLILREQVPLRLIAELCAQLTRRWLLIEWVPPTDPMYQEWLRGRDDLYGHLSESDLLQALAPFFRLSRRQALHNQRVLLLLERSEESNFEENTPAW
jgi:SAM-dependent methyltransferase